MDNAHSLSTPMVVRPLDTNKDPFRPKEDDEMILGPEVPYLSAIGALLYLAQCTRPDIGFSVNLLARYSSAPTRRHWNGIKHILHYLCETTNMGLFYSIEPSNGPNLVGYADSGYLSDPHKGRSQTEILAFHEANRECVWLRSLVHHIRKTCDLSSITKPPTIMYEDNAACIAQIKEGFIKGDRTKNIPPKFFYPHELQKN
ncbi:unnamed protein product [Prunus armeniaca]